MKVQRRFLVVLSLVYGLLAMVPNSYCQESSSTSAVPEDGTYQSQRDFAVGLFKQNHRSEALPIFQQLAKRNPNDTEVIFGWLA
jgi:hypothetical protein